MEGLTDNDIKEIRKKLDKLLLYLIRYPDIKVTISRRGKSIVLDSRIIL